MHRQQPWLSPLLFAIFASLAWAATQVSPNAPGASVLAPAVCLPGLLALFLLSGGNVHDGAGISPAAGLVIIVVMSASTYTLLAIGVRRLAQTIRRRLQAAAG